MRATAHQPTRDGATKRVHDAARDTRADDAGTYDAGTYDVERLRRDFPILAQEVHGKPLAYLDSAATTQKPRAVIDALRDYYEGYNANVHRGVHALSERATAAYEGARQKVQHFVNARDAREIIFVRGATEGINLVASAFGQLRIGKGDEVIVSALEHHSNIVPWQLHCDRVGAAIRVVPINDRGEILLDAYRDLIGPRTRLVAMNHVSNALGTINPAREIVDIAHEAGVPVLLDGAQAVQHLPVDVQALDCDLYVFSGHKMYGPTGIGALYGKRELLEELPPYQGGGEMILSVSWNRTTFNAVPHRFEAGTPHIAGAIGLGAAIDYLSAIGMERIAAYEQELLAYGTEALRNVPRLSMIGTAREKSSVLSFVLDGIHPHDIGTILDQEGIAIRSGHHCAQPVMERFGVTATSRASIGLYSTREELDRLVAALHRVVEVFG
ncbi:MAG: cysteine desulfurase [Candidatus Eiseniibacteriota bacterium]|jgi:cysteine desulfurase/selenocysteine lyase